MCDTVSHDVIVCDIMITPKFKSKNKKINRKENENN